MPLWVATATDKYPVHLFWKLTKILPPATLSHTTTSVLREQSRRGLPQVFTEVFSQIMWTIAVWWLDILNLANFSRSLQQGKRDSQRAFFSIACSAINCLINIRFSGDRRHECGLNFLASHHYMKLTMFSVGPLHWPAIPILILCCAWLWELKFLSLKVHWVLYVLVLNPEESRICCLTWGPQICWSHGVNRSEV